MSHTRIRSASLTAALMSLVLTARAPAADIADDSKFLPSDNNLLVVIQMDKLLTSDSFKKLRKEIPLFDKDFESGFSKEFGFAISNVDRIVYGMNGSTLGSDPVGVFHLKNAVHAEGIQKALEAPRFMGDKETNYKEVKISAFTLYVPDRTSRKAFCIVNEKTLVYGRAKDLRAELERNKKSDLNAGMQAALKEADATATVTIVMDVKTIFTLEKPPPIPGLEFDKIRDGVIGASLTIKVGSDVVLRGVAVCKDAKSAEDAKTQAEAIRKAMVEQLKKVPANVLPKDIMELPGKIKVVTKGNLGEATLTVKDDAIIALIKLGFIPQSPRPDKEKPTEVNPPVEKKP